METLLLVPTAMERDRVKSGLKARGAWREGSGQTKMELCGFGIAAAAAVSSQLIATHRPSRVVLAGIAGAFEPSAVEASAVEASAVEASAVELGAVEPSALGELGTDDATDGLSCCVGGAYWFGDVLCDGIGVGEGSDHVSAGELGWLHLVPENGGSVIGDRIKLELPTGVDGRHGRRCLVTGCAASADQKMASVRVQRAQRILRHSKPSQNSVAVAEDMEGFGVALACSIATVPLSIVRGISNIAGDRNHASWRIDEAIDSVVTELAVLLETV
ncbi:phosphorylase family protein [Rhodopirellula sallentina]|uniref:Nucleoside phosphorylase n=1 Tax=Rhodopirellula sallentina SM41 TaxID=1263870 RepID=M5TS13_9BACT|nr:nucleoside phosphorylase [Rhodopirellula sallentina]EMI51977.1 nucleoside phosphorylase [Rhodopirellula sallentina SM41]